MTVHKTICPYDCPTSCGLLAHVEDGRVVRVQGDPQHPACKGMICGKMRRYERSINDPRRLLTPLVRTGPKGSGQFAPASWDQAARTIAERLSAVLDEAGPGAVLPFYYSGVMSLIQRFCGDAFFGSLGACELVMTLCASAKSAGYKAVMGATGGLDPRELEHSDLLLVWGANVRATRLQTMPDLRTARRRGVRVVLVEACAEEMAAHCDETLLVRPGTDGALALAMMHVLDAEGLADAAFLRQHAQGYEDFRATLGACTPAWAEGVCGVPADRIVALAREFGAAGAPAILLGSGNSRYGNGAMTVRLITILSAFTGAWGRPGGGLCGCSPGGGACVDMARVTRPDLRPAPGRRVNINQLASALDPDGETPVRYLHVYGSNPVASVSNQNGVLRGLAREDLFTVVHERFMTDTARWADVILPATFSVEQADCYAAYGYATFAAAPRLVPPPGQCRSNWDIFRLLAEAMGLDDPHFRRTEEDLLAELLAHPTPLLAAVPQAQRAALATGGAVSLPFADHTAWRTPSGMIEIVNPAEPEPMPRYIPPHGGAEALRLIAVPSSWTLNSIFLERDDLVRSRGAMELLLHPDDAAARSIADGDAVLARNDQGRATFRARLTPLVAPGTVAAVGVFTRDQAPDGSLVNALHHERLSDRGEATTLNDNTVEVERL